MKFKLPSKKYITCAIAVFAAVIAIYRFFPFCSDVFANIAEGTRRLPIYCVNTDEKKVAISFDAAWGADDTDELLRILKENDVKATFFMCGYWVDKYPEEVMKIAANGHDLGNHSATHPHMAAITSDKIREELTKTHDKVYNLTGIEMELFRPPFGEYTNAVIETAEELGYYTIQWDIDKLEIKNKHKF